MAMDIQQVYFAFHQIFHLMLTTAFVTILHIHDMVRISLLDVLTQVTKQSL